MNKDDANVERKDRPRRRLCHPGGPISRKLWMSIPRVDHFHRFVTHLFFRSNQGSNDLFRTYPRVRPQAKIRRTPGLDTCEFVL